MLCALARRLPAVAFAAVATQWTDARTRARLAALPNVTVLEADADVDRIFARTRVLLAPSLWQEACPLVVTEGMLRAIPVVAEARRQQFEALTDQLSEAVEDNSESEEKLAELLPAMRSCTRASARAWPRPE